jgi:8-oxo-dGTP pyrophosphatase MutT (NUDIX family)
MVTVFVVRPGGAGEPHEFLQLRRVPSDYTGGTYQSIRGGIEPGETAPAAALREMREESGLAPLELYRLGQVESFYIPAEDAIWHCPAFCAIVDHAATPALNDEHDAFRWVRADETDQSFMWSSEWPLIEEIKRVIFAEGPAKGFLRLDVESVFTRP